MDIQNDCSNNEKPEIGIRYKTRSHLSSNYYKLQPSRSEIIVSIVYSVGGDDDDPERFDTPVEPPQR